MAGVATAWAVAWGLGALVRWADGFFLFTMGAMLTSQHQAVKGLPFTPMLTTVAMVALPPLFAAWLAWWSGLDIWLAQQVYQPDAVWAGFLREYGAMTGNVAAGIAAVLLLLRLPYPVLNKSAGVLVVTVIFGAGLLNQLVVKDLAERPRPRDVLFEAPVPGAEIKGKSMPSGHAGVVFALAAPGFVLLGSGNRRQRRWGNVILGGAVLAGSAVGMARMVAGAHFLSDVLVAGAISLGFAALAAEVAWRTGFRVPRWILIGVLAVVAAAFVLGNKFKITMTYEAERPWTALDLPCGVTSMPSPQVAMPTLQVELRGYGAPLSQLRLVDDGGIVRIRDEFGVYHSLGCTAVILLPVQ